MADSGHLTTRTIHRGRLILVVASALAVWAASPCALGPARAALAAPHATARRAGSTAVGTPTAPVTISYTSQGIGRPVAARFLGLSFEAAALSQLGSYSRRGDLVALLRSLGPGLLRFGGITADEDVGWTDGSIPPPAWASSDIDPADLRAIGVLARRSGWEVLLTVGLAHYEPAAAASEVAAARAAMGPYLAAVEIGNEPEAYANHGYRQQPWLPQAYEEEISDYREAIEARTPGIPIAGPDSTGSGSFLEWGFAEALAQEPAMLTGHHYPLGCAQTPPPSIELLLSPGIRGRESRSLETYMSVAKADRIPLRIDEAGTVSCGGVAGVSDTFASALWATGYVAQAMAAGVAGINLEGNPNNCAGYTPICAPSAADAAAGRLKAEPSYYGLLLMRSLIGYRALPTTIASEAAPNLAATVFSGPRNSLKLVLSDDEAPGAQALDVRMPVPAGFGPASLQKLAAPSQSATSGVTLDGRQMPADGSWAQPRTLPHVAIHAGYLSFSLPASTAMVVSLGPAPPRHRRRPRRRASQPKLGLASRSIFQPAFNGARK